MPRCGSQIILCDVPIRFDTYKGCSHACEYCFVKKGYDIRNIEKGESHISLQRFIDGQRDQTTNWCDWDIPLHWGGVSDPFQPAEKVHKMSYEALKVFAKTKYPFVVSTKNKMIADKPYLELISQCNCVVQFSAACAEYDKWERGASSFEERLQAAKTITDLGIRVNIRVQPYLPQYFEQIKQSLVKFKEAGVYGVIFESMKYRKKVPNTVKVNGDYCIPVKLLKKQYTVLKALCHSLGMKFYSGENRLRGMSDDLCCCGVDGMGWRVNKANLNHYIYDRENFVFTDKMKEVGTTAVYMCLHQTGVFNQKRKKMTFEQLMLEEITLNNIKALTDNGE